MTGNWALEPRKFCWVIKDRLAAAERPGGYGRNHRKVRLPEEVIRLREHDFTRVVSLLDSPHNLHTYEEIGMPHPGGPGSRGGNWPPASPTSTPPWPSCSTPPQRVLVHLEDFGPALRGCWPATSTTPACSRAGIPRPVAIWIIERLTGRQMGPPGREVVPVTMGWERNGVSRLRLQKISPPAGQLVVAQNPCVLEMGELARRQQREKLVVDELG